MANDEIRLGYIPSRSGEDYHQDLPTPTWGEVTTRWVNAWRSSSSAVMVFVGLIGSPPFKIDGTSSQGPIPWSDVQRLPFQDALEEGIPRPDAFAIAVKRSLDPYWTPYYARKLLGYHNDFRHITGIVLKRV